MRGDGRVKEGRGGEGKGERVYGGMGEILFG